MYMTLLLLPFPPCVSVSALFLLHTTVAEKDTYQPMYHLQAQPEMRQLRKIRSFDNSR